MGKFKLKLKQLFFTLKRCVATFVPSSILNLYYKVYPSLGNLYYGKPSTKIKIIAITGTDGKSSTVLFTVNLLRGLGYRVGYFSSISYSEGEKDLPNPFKMTMPGKFYLQRFLNQLVKNNCEYAVLEVTSEGIKQHRHLCIEFDIALITNISKEHIEAHSTYQNYIHTKSIIFSNLHKNKTKSTSKTIIVNNDDHIAGSFSKFKCDKVISFGEAPDASLNISNIKSEFYQNSFDVRVDGKSLHFQSPAGGPFAVYNIAAALSVLHSLGISIERCVDHVSAIQNPVGRFELVSRNPLVIVDYAHTVFAVEKLLSYIHSKCNQNIIHVFGAAGGGRDKWKRPLLAKISEKYADISILTEENPFDESNINIMNEIKTGFSENAKVHLFDSRSDAVKYGIAQASKHSAVLVLTAKGSEEVIARAYGVKTKYNEKHTVQCILNKK